MSTYPPDGRLDGPVHLHFGLSYSNYLVLHRTLMQSMPEEWQRRMVACLEELDAAFCHVDKPDVFWVQPAKVRTYSELTESDMRRLGITADHPVGEAEPDCYYDDDGGEHDPDDRVLIPVGDDPVPHYGRGRTYVKPYATEATIRADTTSDEGTPA